MAQDPQNQYPSDNSQAQYGNYNPQNYDPAFVNQNQFVPQSSIDQGVSMYNNQYATQQPIQTEYSQQYDPNQYYQAQPINSVDDSNYQYSQSQQPGAYPIDNNQLNYQSYPQTNIYGQVPAYQNDETPVTPINNQPTSNYNPITNTFDPIVQNYSTDLPDPNLQPIQNYNFSSQDLNTQPQSGQFSQEQYNNFEPNYDPENQFDPNNPEPSAHEGSFFSNKRNLIIVGLVILMIGLITSSGILFYFKSQENSSSNLVQNNDSSAIVANNPNTSTVIKTSSVSPTPSSQGGRAVAVGTTVTGGPGTPATNAKKTNITKLPGEWLKVKFTGENLNDDGTCKVVSVCGEKADFDNDGLTNIDEFNFQTDPLNADTDGDGLSDGDETNIYYTDPTKKDSDNDTYEDGDEITNCYDPITATNTKFSAARKSQITSIATTVPLHKSTMDKLKKVNATNDDLDKGYIQIKCGPPTNIATTNSSTTPATRPAKNNS